MPLGCMELLCECEGLKMGLGIPVHFRPTRNNRSACGIEFPEYASYEPRDVNCYSCRKTVVWKTRMGHSKNKKLEAIEWAIHSCNKQICQIREHEVLTEEQKQRQIEAHESYLRTLFSLLDEVSKIA
jgi:hypothetical protein